MQKMTNHNKNLNLRSRIQSLGHAIDGMTRVLKEPNIKIHLLATIVVITVSAFSNLPVYKWIALCFAIGLVWVTEIMNTAIEMLCDYASNNQKHPVIKNVKDIAAAAVLCSSIISLVIGILIFIV